MAELEVYGWPHVERVHCLAIHISKFEGEQGLDLDALKASALLHDIVKIDERNRGVDHGKIGAEMAENFLKSLGFAENKIKIAYNAIRAPQQKGETHRI